MRWRFHSDHPQFNPDEDTPELKGGACKIPWVGAVVSHCGVED